MSQAGLKIYLSVGLNKVTPLHRKSPPTLLKKKPYYFLCTNVRYASIKTNAPIFKKSLVSLVSFLSVNKVVNFFELLVTCSFIAFFTLSWSSSCSSCSCGGARNTEKFLITNHITDNLFYFTSLSSKFIA